MTLENAINQAKEVVGRGQKDDYKLMPTKNADEFRDKAPDLAAILYTSELTITSEQYETKDRDANEAQKEFRLIFNRANTTVLITAVLIALILATGIIAPLLPDTIEKVLLIGLSIGSIIAGALASKDLNRIRQGKLLGNWMTKRAAAELIRVDYFNTVALSEAPAASGEIPIDLLKLEYFRRFQLEVQLAFFTERAKDHNRDAKKTLSYSSWSIAGAAVVTGLAGILSVLNPQFAVIATLGAIFAALSSFATIHEQIYQSQQIAERYALTADALQNLYKRLDAVRKAIYSTGQKPLIDFVEAVQEQLSLEHKQWLGEQTAALGALAKLEDTLKKTASQSGNKPAAH